MVSIWDLHVRKQWLCLDIMRNHVSLCESWPCTLLPLTFHTTFISLLVLGTKKSFPTLLQLGLPNLSLSPLPVWFSLFACCSIRLECFYARGSVSHHVNILAVSPSVCYLSKIHLYFHIKFKREHGRYHSMKDMLLICWPLPNFEHFWGPSHLIFWLGNLDAEPYIGRGRAYLYSRSDPCAESCQALPSSTLHSFTALFTSTEVKGRYCFKCFCLSFCAFVWVQRDAGEGKGKMGLRTLLASFTDCWGPWPSLWELLC